MRVQPLRLLTTAPRRLLAAAVRPLVTAEVQRALAARPDPAHEALHRPVVYGDERRLHVSPDAVVNDALFNLSSGEITVEADAFFGHGVAVLTGTHDVTVHGRGRKTAVPTSGRDVVIRRGAWVASRAVVQGPSEIGEHAVVATGAVVTGDVAPYTVVAGIPARPVRELPRDGGRPLPASAFARLYPAFEARFRGTPDEVRERLATAYLDDVRAAATGAGVLDVGIGRGEWLELLGDEGIAARGVDRDAAFAAAARGRGLEVAQGDGMRWLAAQPEGGADVVTAFHVVEHLSVDEVLAFLAAAARALRPGGLLVVETPDPRNLVMAACNFHLDPTHRVPLPPALTTFLVETAALDVVEVRDLHRKEDVDLSGLRLEGVDERTRGIVIAALDRTLFGPQDYAVLARRRPERS